MHFAREGLDEIVIDKLKMQCADRDMEEWETLVAGIKTPRQKVKVGIVGKYVSLPDAYLSIAEALRHGGFHHQTDVEIEWIDSEELENGLVDQHLHSLDGILVPGGFGYRGIEGKIEAIRYAREQKIPFFGICLGMQCAVMEFARNVCGLVGANSSEFVETEHPVIDLMPEQVDVEDMGGTMRLGVYPCVLDDQSRSGQAYGEDTVDERHRHRYEFNNSYRSIMEDNGMLLAGVSPDGRLVEIVEIPDHPWFVGSQFHPEFKSRPNNPHPLFRDFVGAAVARQASLAREVS